MFVALAAIWGASFLFMRIAAPYFGVWWTAELRVALAALAMAGVALGTGRAMLTRRHWRGFLVVGTFNSAIPFALYAYAALHLPTGYSAILNALTPLWGALFAAWMLGERLTLRVVAGVALALAGVSLLVKVGVGALDAHALAAVAACLAATACYGFAGAYTKKALSGVATFAIATNSQLFAAVVLLPAAAWQLPAANPPLQAWWAMLLLALLCSAVAYFLYFALIARLGPTRATTVTFVVPAFGMLWGWLLLGEPVTLAMLLGFALVLAATALVMGFGPFAARAVAAPDSSAR